ncbi:MAG: amidohydrolase family protein [Actinomycetota bacterium]
MIIDAHVHYEPEILPMERMLACMDKHGIDKAALIAPANEPFYLSGSWLENNLGKVMRNCLYYANPLGHILYQTLFDKKGENVVLLGKKYHIFKKPDNALVAQAVEENLDRLLGWIFINPEAEVDPVVEVERWSTHPGMVGVKAVPFWHDYPVSELDRVASWCREHGCPILMHIGCRGGSGNYRRLPEKYPGLKVIYAHAGIPYFRKLWSYAKDKQGVYVDLSGPGYLDRKFIGEAVDFLGADRCLYGTDGPYGDQSPGEDFDYGLRKAWIESLPLSDRELEKIFHENFEGILED